MAKTTLCIFTAATLLATSGLVAQPCLNDYTYTSSPLPVNGTYGCGETVTFCFTVTNWNSTNANWFHGIVANFGPGWDLATLVPGPPPATFGASGGTWGWYNSVSGTAGTASGPQGPGYFFDLNNDGNPGNNFGDFATGAVNWEFCWTISVLSAPACTNGLDLSVTVNTFGDSETGSWGSSGCTGDPVGVSPPAVIQACSANAGSSATATYCNDATPVQLFSLLGGTPDATGTWTGPSGAAFSGTLDPSTGVNGSYTYLVNDLAGGCSAQATVDITLHVQPDAGTDASTTVCTSSAAFGLLPLLGGSADPGGTWVAPDGSPSSGTFTPATDAGGIYAYQQIGSAPCVNVQSEVTVVVNPSANAGGNGNLVVCSTGAPAALFTQLTGVPSAGGVWTDPGLAIISGIYDPAVNAPGAYTYTVPGLAPCPSSIATVTVTENAQPDAGVDATTTVCVSSAAVGLLPLLGSTADPGGSWIAPDGSPFSGTFAPATDAGGIYTYQLVGSAPCVNVQSEVTVVVNPSANAGGNGNLVVCSTSLPAALFPFLTGLPTAGGVWTGPDLAVISGVYDPIVNTPGVYNYTVTGLAPCPNGIATVTVTENMQPDAGLDAATIFCETDAAVALVGLLGGTPDPGGSWVDPLGAAIGATLTPGTALDGNYTYTTGANAPCVADQSIVSVTINAQPTAGNNGVLTLCEGSPPTDMFIQLGGTPASGGTWTDAMGTATGASFDPATQAPGTYTYTVSALAPCLATSADVIVSVSGQPIAGNDASTTPCSSDAEFALFPLLGFSATPTGSWSDPSGSATTGNFTPGTSPDGAYTYTVLGTAPCTTVSAVVTVNTTAAADPGADGMVDLCETANPVDLFGELSGTPSPGGTWTTSNGSPYGALLDPSTAASGNYTYTLPPNGPCAAASAQVSVTIAEAPDAGSSSAMSICSTAADLVLLPELGGTPDPSGTWTAPNGSAHGAEFDPAVDPSGDYTYTVPGLAPCAAASSVLTITGVEAVSAGSGGALAICANASPVDLFGNLSDAPTPGGTWTGPNGSPVIQLDPSTANSGTYTYTVLGTAPCPNAQSTVQVAIDALPEAGTDGNISACADASAFNLSSQLGGAPWNTGTWTGPAGSATNLFTPGSNVPGLYTYTVDGTGACAQVSVGSTVLVAIDPLPIPSIIATIVLGCIPLEVDFQVGSVQGVGSAAWQFGDGSSASSGGSILHTYTEAGEFSIHLVVTDTNGCTGSVIVNDLIRTSGGPSAFFYATPEKVSTEAPDVSVVRVNEPMVTTEWTIDGAGVEQVGSFNWTFASTTAVHEICLTATDTLGCANTHCQLVLVDDVLTAFVPNAFTPDGDGTNDVFLPSVIGLDVEAYTFSVFDRWGNVVFSTTDPQEGWNGGLQNAGAVQQQDVYVWRILARDQFTADRKELFGTATLVK